MTPIEAYKLTLHKIEELKGEDIEITATLCPSKDNKEEPNGIPREKWIHIIFLIKNESDIIKINKTADYLGMCGITFDISGNKGCRNWELDWSFSYTGKEDEEWRDKRNEVENLINNLN